MASQLPVGRKFSLIDRSPLEYKGLYTAWQSSVEYSHRLNADNRFELAIDRVEMRYTMLTKIHVNHNAKKLRYLWHWL